MDFNIDRMHLIDKLISEYRIMFDKHIFVLEKEIDDYNTKIVSLELEVNIRNTIDINQRTEKQSIKLDNLEHEIKQLYHNKNQMTTIIEKLNKNYKSCLDFIINNQDKFYEDYLNSPMDTYEEIYTWYKHLID
jgi:chromosome segregation ATPase